MVLEKEVLTDQKEVTKLSDSKVTGLSLLPCSLMVGIVLQDFANHSAFLLIGKLKSYLKLQYL